MKKVFALLASMPLLMPGTAFSVDLSVNQSPDSFVPDEVTAPNSNVVIQRLEPAPDSEFVLDQVLLIKSKKEKGDAVTFEYSVEPDSCETEADIEIIVDREKGTYKATKRNFVPAEVKARAGKLPGDMEQRLLDLKKYREEHGICPPEKKTPEHLNRIEGSPTLQHAGYHSRGIPHSKDKLYSR